MKEELLLQSQILNYISEGINLVKAENGKIVYSNSKFDEMFGYESGELIGKHISIVNAPTEDKCPEKKAKEILNSMFNENEWKGEVCNIKKDGTIFWCFASVSWFNHPKHGKVAVSVTRDITERKQIEKELQESEEKLRNIFENSTNLFYSHTADHILTYLSPQANQILGYTPEEAMVNWTKLASDNPINDIGFNYTVKAIETGKQQPTYELELIHKSGRKVMVEVREAPVLKNGKTVSIVGALTDITERKKAENKLFKNQYYLKKAQEIGSIGTWELDIQKNILIWTDEIYKIFGVPTGTEMNTELFLSCVHPDDRDFVNKKWNAALNNEPYDTEHRLIVKNKIKWVREKADVEFDMEGNPIMAIGFAQDITEQKIAEKALRESEENLSMIYKTTAEILFQVGVESNDCYRFLMVNKAFVKTTGLKENLIVGKTIEEVIPKSSIKLVHSKYKEAIRERKTVQWEETSEYPTGVKFGFVTISPIFNENGQCIYLIGSVNDFTERKKAELALNKSNKKLRELTMYMQESIENERMKIALDLHDDLGQKLTALNMDLSWLKTKTLNNLPQLSDKLNEMTDLLNLTMQNVQKIATELRPSVLDDLGLIPTIEWLLKDYKSKSKIKYQFNVSPQELIIKKRLSVAIFRIIQEALTNVARHANASLVKVSILKENKFLNILIEDNGKGISKKNMEDSKSFGLMGIKERANIFNGKLKIIGELNKGTKLKIKIPYE